MDHVDPTSSPSDMGIITPASVHLLPKESLLSAPVLLLAEHILGSIPLWEVKSKKSGAGLREKEVTREVFYRGQLRKIPLVIYASGDLGLPNSVDLELFRGFERWALSVLDREKTLPAVVRISATELLNYAGKECAGSAYAEVDRFFLRMKGTMIAAGRSKTVLDSKGDDRDDQGKGAKRQRSKRGIAFQIFGTVVVPGQVNGVGQLADKYEVELASWYRESLLMGNCFVVDHSLFREMKGSLSKLLHQLLHNLFCLGKGHAEQRYSDLVQYWQISRYQAKSRVREQFEEAHRELVSREFLQSWDVLPTQTNGQKDFILVWEAGPAWWKTERQLNEMRMKYHLGGEADNQALLPTAIDPFLTALPDDSQRGSENDDASSAARLLYEVLEISGRRKDPKVWENWWKRALATVPHPFIWRRIGEVRERKARGEKLNMGSYLSKLVKIDAQKLGAAWASDR
jgi:hypothetical protein